jgi:altronate dehydratase
VATILLDGEDIEWFKNGGERNSNNILGVLNIKGYISALVETALIIKYTGYTNLPDVLKDTVTIDREGILFTDFSLTKK